MERQPKQAVGSTPPWRSKIFKSKKEFRTQPPLLDRRVGLVGELFKLGDESLSFSHVLLLSGTGRPNIHET